MADDIEYDWDENKNRANRREHGIDFVEMWRFEWEEALVEVDDREDYGELREIAYGFIGVQLVALVFVQEGDTVRVISLRKASKKEGRKYARVKG